MKAVSSRHLEAHEEFPETPAIYLTVADGVHMPKSSARRVVTFSKDGTRVERIFYEADVELPVLSMADQSDEGESGSEVCFRRRDGYIEDAHSGRRCFFLKLKDVYVVELYVPKVSGSQCLPKSGVARPA